MWREGAIGLIANMGGMVVGTCIAWPSPVYSRLTDEANKEFCCGPFSEEQFAIAASIFFVTAAIGAMLGFFGAWQLGRRRTLLLAAAALLVSWFLTATACRVIHIYGARVISGLASGIIFVVNPMYVAEMTRSHWRDILCSLIQFEFYLGVLLVYVLGPQVPPPYLAWTCLALVLLWAIALLPCPESPVYLTAAGYRDRALETFMVLRGDPVLAEAEVDKLESNMSSWNILGELCACDKSPTSRGLIITCCLLVIQQCSGISVIIMEASKIFEVAGGCISPERSTVLIGIIQIIASVLCPLIIDNSGRRPLLLLSSAGMVVSLLVLGIYMCALTSATSISAVKNIQKWGLVCPTSLIVYVIMFCLGYGPIPPIITSEFFDENRRPLAYAITATTGWITAFFIYIISFYMRTKFGYYVIFFIFSCACANGFIFVSLFLPETKNQTYQQIRNILTQSRMIHIRSTHNDEVQT